MWAETKATVYQYCDINLRSTFRWRWGPHVAPGRQLPTPGLWCQIWCQTSNPYLGKVNFTFINVYITTFLYRKWFLKTPGEASRSPYKWIWVSVIRDLHNKKQYALISIYCTLISIYEHLLNLKQQSQSRNFQMRHFSYYISTTVNIKKTCYEIHTS